MHCSNCGTQLDDNARFCFGCGSQVANDTPAGTKTTKNRFEKPNNQNKKKISIPIITACAVLVVAAVIAVCCGLFGGDSVKVASAFAKSSKAFTNAVEKMELTDVVALVEGKKVSEDLSIWIDEIDGSTEMKGMGLRLSADSDLPGRYAALSVTPYMGSVDPVTFQMAVDDSEIYVGSPELTGGTFYMVNTKTVCQDLDNMGADMGDAAYISFNIFDLIEKVEELYGTNDDLIKAIQKAATEMAKEIEVEKTGTKTIDVNDNDLKCTVYDVVIPENAIHDFLDEVEEAYTSVDNTEALIELMESIGVPDYVISEMEYSLEYSMDYSTDDILQAFSSLHYALEQLGNIELKLYLNGGYIVAAVYENTIDGTDIELTMNIGGGKNYVDDISLRLIADDEEYSIVSSGNHAGSGNTFTDETVFEYNYDGRNYDTAKLTISYAPKESEDNLNIKLTADSVSVQVRGQLSCKKDSMNLYLDKVSISEYGDRLAVLGMELKYGKYDGDTISVKNHKALANMTEYDLMEVAEEITEYASDWAMGLDSDIQYILSDILYELF